MPGGAMAPPVFQKDPKDIDDYFISFGIWKYEQISGTPIMGTLLRPCTQMENGSLRALQLIKDRVKYFVSPDLLSNLL